MENVIRKADDVEVTVIKGERDTDKIIADHVGFSLLAGAIPVPLLDIAAVSAIQVDMLRQLARKHEVSFDEEAGKSVVSAILGSALGTAIGRAGASAVKAIPGIGTLLGIASQVALSGITTFAIGHLFNAHFSDRRPLSDFRIEDVKEVFEDLLRKGKDFVDSFQKKASKDAADVREETAVVLRNMADKGVLKREDCERIIKALGNRES
ncbi:MAG: DUF697 domain-containing protein [Spirochaetales bacterium]|nr:DUF697 domain-containing protein [Spirochaetales bacterium]